jgi:5-methylcytosine-specific restriction endonuclease McrA
MNRPITEETVKKMDRSLTIRVKQFPLHAALSILMLFLIFLNVAIAGLGHLNVSQDLPVLSPSERNRKINEYFIAANENVGALDCNIVIHKRNVDESTKLAVRRRDNYRCVICGNVLKLEIDHKRALENGGTNEMSNLAILCDDCYVIKTKLDNSLQRKRENICRKK